MVRMVEPISGAVFDVAPERVATRVSWGWRLADEPDEPTEDGPAQTDEPAPETADAPDETWTVAEIRAYAARHGIDLPRGGKKSDLLALI